MRQTFRDSRADPPFAILAIKIRCGLPRADHQEGWNLAVHERLVMPSAS